ncbi:MAG: TrbC/VirB2 family protein [Patescibacteria group bacterium]
MKKLSAFILSFLIIFSFGFGIIYGQTTKTTNPVDDKTTNPVDDKTKNPIDDKTVNKAGDVSADITLDNPFAQEGSLVDLLNLIIEKIIFPIGGVLAILAFIYAGFKYVTAQGDTTKIKEAHQTLLYVVIGTAILLGARVISEVISGTINQLK